MQTLDDLDAERVRAALGLSGDGWEVASTPVGAGQVARCVRFEFRRDHERHRAVAKLPSRDETSRSTAKLQALYLREVAFYTELASQVEIRTPRLIHAERDEESDDFLLVLEDLTPSSTVEQVDGLSTERTAMALTQLAGLHGPTAGREDLFARRWLGGVASDLTPLYAAVLPGLFAQFLERYEAELDGDMRTCVERLGRGLRAFTDFEPAVRCVQHSDYRSENMIFDGRSGEVPLAIVDWQTVSAGSPMLDVAYFLVTSLTTEQRLAIEQEMIDHYLGEMSGRGIVLDPERARREYARYTLQPVVMLVAASVIVERTARGDEMFLTMIRRGVDAATQWGALEALGA
jgi:aminoglycoside/choline kinase family phosphotransferase